MYKSKKKKSISLNTTLNYIFFQIQLYFYS